MNENEGWPEVGAKCSSGGGCMVVTKTAGVYVVRDTKTGQCLVFGKQEYAEHRRQILEGRRSRVLLRLLKQAVLLAQSTRCALRLTRDLVWEIRG
ncbi:MAG TPA: hypothetical protein VG253_27590 [Streptosporangiaceae bacterium]|jgi:hypothetical protein|nr:hypothetical protein [Streptosporangiaceae bacterium]